MKKSITTLFLCSSLLLFGCQNENNNNSEESSNSVGVENSVSHSVENSNVAVESGNSNSEENSTVIADDGTVVTVVPEDKKIYIDENTWMDGTDLYKTTQNKEDRKDRKSEIVVDGKNYYLSYIFPNPDDDTKVDLWYEEY